MHVLLLLSCSVMSDAFWPRGQQHAGFPCPSPSPRVFSESRPLRQWCYLIVSSSAAPFSFFRPQSCQHQGLFQWVRPLHQVANVLELQHQSLQWIVRLISFRMDWLDLLAVQRTLKILLQHHNWKASILLCSVFFIVQLSHPYMTTGKTIALTRQTFVSKVMSAF